MLTKVAKMDQDCSDSGTKLFNCGLIKNIVLVYKVNKEE